MKILTETFRLKLIVYSFILAFLDHLKPKTFLADIEPHPPIPSLFKISGSTPARVATIANVQLRINRYEREDDNQKCLLIIFVFFYFCS